jgi:hypothetical protein
MGCNKSIHLVTCITVHTFTRPPSVSPCSIGMAMSVMAAADSLPAAHRLSGALGGNRLPTT